MKCDILYFILKQICEIAIEFYNILYLSFILKFMIVFYSIGLRNQLKNFCGKLTKVGMGVC